MRLRFLLGSGLNGCEGSADGPPGRVCAAGTGWDSVGGSGGGSAGTTGWVTEAGPPRSRGRFGDAWAASGGAVAHLGLVC